MILILLGFQTPEFQSDTETEDDQDITAAEKDNDPGKLNIQESKPQEEIKIQKKVQAVQ